MNALANSQMEEIDTRIAGSGFEKDVVCKRLTGQENQEERERIRSNLPDIILTNFMMLEMLLTRQDTPDRDIITNASNLEYLVLDELHTYRDRHGADVAMLVRRLRERIGSDRLICIGTSATMASEGDSQNRREQVAKVASLLFSTQVTANEVVTETLWRRTAHHLSPGKFSRSDLAAALQGFGPLDASADRPRTDPFMVWIEMTMGLRASPGGGSLDRAAPMSIDEAGSTLAAATGLPVTECRRQLELALETTSRPERERGGKGDDVSFFRCAFTGLSLAQGSFSRRLSLSAAGRQASKVKSIYRRAKTNSLITGGSNLLWRTESSALQISHTVPYTVSVAIIAARIMPYA